MLKKHGMKPTYVAKMAKYAAWKREGKTTTYNLWIRVNKWRCNSQGQCVIVAQQNVKQVVQTKKLSDGKPRGFVTMYCPGQGDHCQPFVHRWLGCPATACPDSARASVTAALREFVTVEPARL